MTDAPEALSMPAGASRRASAFPIAVLVLLLAARVADVLWGGQARQVPFTVALFVLPLLYATPAVQPLLARHRPLVLISQGLLTWVPFAVFGGSWQIGIGGLLAGLVLLMLAAPLSWVLAGGLVVAEVGVRAGLAGLPAQPGWLGGVAVVVFYVNDGLLFFAMVRLAQCVGEVDHARAAAAGLAVAGERLSSAQELQAAIGEGLSSIAAIAAAAQRELPGDAARAREGIAAAGAAARDAIAQAREVTARQRGGGGSEPALVQPRGAVIANRLAWAVLIAVLLAFVIENVSVVVTARYGARLEGFAIADIVVVMVLQLYHSRAIRVDRRPRAWPVTLGLQAVLVYASFFPFVAAYVGALAGFVAGSALLLVPGRWRWAGFAAVTVSWPVLSVTLPARGWPPPFGLHVADTL
ncbi:MAG: hypothetical protein J2P28_22820, partial [Actinobacteria bacterium]|nr:hypothetical protein [Actinomycetota bacterium]